MSTDKTSQAVTLTETSNNREEKYIRFWRAKHQLMVNAMEKTKKRLAHRMTLMHRWLDLQLNHL